MDTLTATLFLSFFIVFLSFCFLSFLTNLVERGRKAQ